MATHTRTHTHTHAHAHAHARTPTHEKTSTAKKKQQQRGKQRERRFCYFHFQNLRYVCGVWSYLIKYDQSYRARTGWTARCNCKNRDPWQTTTATATRTWQNKRSNEQNNSSARAFSKCAHFLVVLCKMTTWNHQNLRGPRKATSTANYLRFHLELNAALLCDAEVNLRRRKGC